MVWPLPSICRNGPRFAPQPFTEQLPGDETLRIGDEGGVAIEVGRSRRRGPRSGSGLGAAQDARDPGAVGPIPCNWQSFVDQVGTPPGAASWMTACTNSWITTRSSVFGDRSAPSIGSRIRAVDPPPAHAGARVMSWN